MSTDPNPQQLLRRPKKAQPKAGGTGIVLAAIGGAVVVAGGIAAFAMFGHAKSAASPHVTAQLPAAASPVLASDVEPVSHAAVAHRSARHAANGVKPQPADSPTPDSSPTPEATPTASDEKSAQDASASDAKAKHEAAARVAALRRLQALQSGGSTGVPSASNGGRATQNVATTLPSAAPVQTQAPVPAASTTDDALYEPSVVVDARFVNRVSPAYPDMAREQGASGTAIVLATVGPTGNVLSVAIDQSTGNKLLDGAALSAARESRFEPPEINGKPATETYRIVYTFDPNG